MNLTKEADWCHSFQSGGFGIFLASSEVICRKTRQGFPTAMTPDGMSLLTTLPAPITTLLPIVTPGKTVTPAPIHTSFPMLIG